MTSTSRLSRRIDIFVCDSRRAPLSEATVSFEVDGQLAGEVPNALGRASIELDAGEPRRVTVSVRYHDAIQTKQVSEDASSLEFQFNTLSQAPLSSDDGSHTTGGRNPIEQKVTSATPSRKLQRVIAGVVAIATSAATIYGLYEDKRIAIVGFIGMVFAIILVLAVQRAIREFGSTNQRFYDILVKILVGFVVTYFIVLTAALGPALYRFITDSTPNKSSNDDKPLRNVFSKKDLVGTWHHLTPTANTSTTYEEDGSLISDTVDTAGHHAMCAGKYSLTQIQGGAIAASTPGGDCPLDWRWIIAWNNGRWEAVDSKMGLFVKTR